MQKKGAHFAGSGGTELIKFLAEQRDADGATPAKMTYASMAGTHRGSKKIPPRVVGVAADDFKIKKLLPQSCTM